MWCISLFSCLERVRLPLLSTVAEGEPQLKEYRADLATSSHFKVEISSSAGLTAKELAHTPAVNFIDHGMLLSNT